VSTTISEKTSDDHRAGEKLEGKVALVTGGNRGIGAAICNSLATQGASVAAGYTSDKQKAESFLATLLEKASRPASTGGTSARPTTAGGPSTRFIDKPVLKMADEDWYSVLAVNLSGAFFMSQATLPHMIERGCGRIVNISSIIGQQGNIGQANYAASKSGLFGLTMTLAREAAQALKKADKLSDDGVGLTVNAMAPGFIATDMVEHVPDKVVEKIKGQIPLGRLGRPEEVARVVHFLCADASSYITGQAWAVNGGMEMAGH